MDETLNYSITYQDVVSILRAVRETEAIDSFSLEFGDLKLHVTRTRRDDTSGFQQARAATPSLPISSPFDTSIAAVESAPEKEISEHAVADSLDAEVVVTAPMIGTFYRAPSPTDAPFVKVGEIVTADQTIGLIEAMKLFTEIRAGTAGRIARFLAQNATLVEFGQALVTIDLLRDGEAQ